MNTRILISQNSQSINLATLCVSLGASIFCLSVLGYFGIPPGIFFVYQEYKFLRTYEVFLDNEYFYFSRYYYDEVKISKEELIDFSERKGYFNFSIYCLELKGNRKFSFIGIHKSLSEPNEFPIRQFLKDLVISNGEKNKIAGGL